MSFELAQDRAKEAEDQSRPERDASANSTDLRAPLSPKRQREAGEQSHDCPASSLPQTLCCSVPNSLPRGCQPPACEPITPENSNAASSHPEPVASDDEWSLHPRSERLDGFGPDGELITAAFPSNAKPHLLDPSPLSLHTPRKPQAKPTAKQRGLGFDGQVLKETIIRKLREYGDTASARTLAGCHTQKWIQLCNGCRAQRVFYNRCENFFCPCCAKRLASERRKSVEWWAEKVDQAKHVVLTARNTEEITKAQVLAFKAAFAKLRRRAIAKNWKGGFYALEITNEGKGWHLHLHAFVQARWIDQSKLAVEWANCIGQSFAIVYVKDGRKADYLRELCKYVTDGNEVAKWSGSDIAAYIAAFTGVRTFGCFGDLYKLRSEHRAFLDSIQSTNTACPCGCTSFRYFDENEWEWFECNNGPNAPPKCSDEGSNPAKTPELFGDAKF